MPRPGDQHLSGMNNPFEEEKPQISAWTAAEVATLQNRLDKQLGPEFISSRKGPNGRNLYYLPAEKAINLANDVFGFNGWSSSVRDTTIDFVDQSQSTGKVSLGLSVIMRVTLKDGTYHEDVGYGHIENCPGKAAAFEKAKKEAATDAMKRALRTFGNVLGNCLYDKSYESRISKMRAPPAKWNPDNLHRHTDYVPAVKTETAHGQAEQKLNIDPRQIAVRNGESNATDLEDEFDCIDFEQPDDSGGSTTESAPTDQSDSAGRQSCSRPPPSMAPVRPPPHGMQPELQQRPAMARGASSRSDVIHTPHAAPPPPGRAATGPPIARAALPDSKGGVSSAEASAAKSDQTKAPQSAPQDPQPPVRFVTGRAAELLLKAEAANRAPAQPPQPFNPHSESPSLRRTLGINHKTSGPVKKEVVAERINVGGTGANANTPMRGGNHPAPGAMPNAINHHGDLGRKVGMPNLPPNPNTNRQSYKPPAMKRPAEAQARPALAEMTNLSVDRQPSGPDSKRLKIHES